MKALKSVCRGRMSEKISHFASKKCWRNFCVVEILFSDAVAWEINLIFLPLNFIFLVKSLRAWKYSQAHTRKKIVTTFFMFVANFRGENFLYDIPCAFNYVTKVCKEENWGNKSLPGSVYGRFAPSRPRAHTCFSHFKFRPWTVAMDSLFRRKTCFGSRSSILSIKLSAICIFPGFPQNIDRNFHTLNRQKKRTSFSVVKLKTHLVGVVTWLEKGSSLAS